MTQKIIKVGSSVGTIIPKDVLESFRWKAGDNVTIDIDKERQEIRISKPGAKIEEVADWSDGFIKKYKKALDALSQK